jgi:hypothetical protein
MCLAQDIVGVHRDRGEEDKYGNGENDDSNSYKKHGHWVERP